MDKQPELSTIELDEEPRLLDGGMGTTLQDCIPWSDKRKQLWASALLLEHPEAIGEAHAAFLDAGADVITACTYQATIPGFVEHCGLTVAAAEELLRDAVRLAHDARENKRKHLRENSMLLSSLDPVISVFCSCGPFGAYMADGSEYTAIYPGGLTDEGLKNFHRSRLRVLIYDAIFDASTGDKIVFETLPSMREAVIAYGLLREFPQLSNRVGMSFVLDPSSQRICLPDGTSLTTVVTKLLEMDARNKFLSFLGLNCNAPDKTVAAYRELQQILN